MTPAIKSLKKHPDAVIALLLFLIPLQFYRSLGAFEFLNFDDPVYVTNNDIVKQGLTWEGVFWAFSTHTIGHWHPLTWISHMADISLFGMNPQGHHLMNVFIFALGASLVFLLLRRLSFDREWAFLGTLFFMLHPLRLESVAWIAERKDVLSFLFGMISLNGYFYAVSRAPSPTLKKIAYGCALLGFILSLLAKPTFVTIPILFLLYHLYVEKIKLWKMWAENIAPFAIFASASIGQAIYTQLQDGALKSVSLYARLENLVISLMVYFGKFFLPFEIAIFYPRKSYSSAIIAAGSLFLLVFITALFQRRKVWAGAWFGWAWFIVTALPFSGFIPIGGQMYADRWTLLPHVGLMIMSLSLLKNCRIVWLRKLLGGIAVMGVAFLTIHFMPYWRDSESIFTQTLKTNPANFMAHTNLGVALADRGEWVRAEKHYIEAVRLNPDYAEALNNLGTALARRSDWDKAIILFEKASRMDPSLAVARSNLNLAIQAKSRNSPNLMRAE